MNNHSTLQRIGNKNKPRTITDTSYLTATKDAAAAFQAILILEPDATLFQWTSISNIPMGSLDNAINLMSNNALRLQYPPSPQYVSDLTEACRKFRAAYKTKQNMKTSLYRH
jgi:hypothetical protein